MEFPHPLLVCDIGGTNVRMAWVDEPAATPRLLSPRLTAGFPDFDTCVEQALAELGGPRPRSMLACGAGPVVGRHLHLTNARWTLDGPQIAYRLGLSQGLLLNDFEAQALSLPSHRAEWLVGIGGVAPSKGLRLILGPGTGLGVAGLLFDGGRHLPLPSEAAHAEFGPVSAEDFEIWEHIERAQGRVSAETLVSGPGLVRLHQARTKIRLSGPDIVQRARLDARGDEAMTLRHFWQLVARLSGDLALTFLARGGVTLSGGILPKILPFLDAAAFRQTFEAKAPMDGMARSIATDLLIAKDAVLTGMAAIAARPQAYLIDYEARAWR